MAISASSHQGVAGSKLHKWCDRCVCVLQVSRLHTLKALLVSLSVFLFILLLLASNDQLSSTFRLKQNQATHSNSNPLTARIWRTAVSHEFWPCIRTLLRVTPPPSIMESVTSSKQPAAPSRFHNWPATSDKKQLGLQLKSGMHQKQGCSKVVQSKIWLDYSTHLNTVYLFSGCKLYTLFHVQIISPSCPSSIKTCKPSAS